MARAPPALRRYVVYQADLPHGLTNRLIPAATIFLTQIIPCGRELATVHSYVDSYALLTDRLFRIAWSGMSPLEEVFDFVTFNLTAAPWEFDPSLGPVAELNYSTTFETGTRDFLLPDLLQRNASARIIRIRLDTGQLPALFRTHRRTFFGLGLRPKTAFGCILHFLLRPSAETVLSLAATWRAVLSHETAASLGNVPRSVLTALNFTPADLNPVPRVRIGVQIRYGDHAFARHRTCLSREGDLRFQLLKPGSWREAPPSSDGYASAFFRCAHELEDSLHTPVVFVIISDCEPVRRMAFEVLPDKVITFLPDSGQPKLLHSQGGGRVAMQVAASELWLFAFTDFQVITVSSGFGRFASFLSLKWHHTYTMTSVHRPPCYQNSSDQWRDLANAWTRI